MRSKKFGKKKTKQYFCLQSHIFISTRGERTDQQTAQALHTLVHSKQHCFTSPMGTLQGNVSREIFELGIRQGGLHLKQSTFKLDKGKFLVCIQLDTDMFASPGNKKLTQFVSRWQHWQAKQNDALNCLLEGLGGLYANPAWLVTVNWLHRLKQNTQAQCLMVCPYWVFATWWPLLKN